MSLLRSSRPLTESLSIFERLDDVLTADEVISNDERDGEGIELG